MEVPFVSSYQVRQTAGDPVAVVRVRNLSTTVIGPQDAWGRVGKSQPALVSAEVSFCGPFGTAAAEDKLGHETVHYGTLSKRIQSALVQFNSQSENAKFSLKLLDVVDSIWKELTGLRFVKLGNSATKSCGYVLKARYPETVPAPLLSLDRIRYLAVQVLLPKASLLGEGVSLLASCAFQSGEPVQAGLAMQLHKVRVPTLVGLNDNERTAKQVVAATVEIDQLSNDEDYYVQVERSVVDIMERSDFGTLEALGTKLAESVLDMGNREEVRVCLEKPTAVTFAECPEVEVRMSQNGRMSQ